MTDFQRRLMITGGLPADRIRVLPNFVASELGVPEGDRVGAVFVGRLAVEKGVNVLLAAASRAPGVISIVGDGPMAAEVASADGTVRYLGRLPRQAVIDAISRSVALVLPSVWFEGFPLVVLEAFATGTPIIASGIGGLAEVVEDGVTGLIVEPASADELADRISWAMDHPAELRAMGRTARLRYDARYRPEHHLAGLLATYQSAIFRHG